MHTALTWCCSLANRTHANTKLVIGKFFFELTASLNVWVPHQGPGYTARDPAYTQYCQYVVPAPIEPASEFVIAQYEIFSQHGKFECMGAASSLKISHIWNDMHVALTGCRRLANRTHPDTKLFRSWGQIFPIAASSNVSVPHQASRYITADIACTQHWQSVIVLQIESISQPKFVETWKDVGYLNSVFSPAASKRQRAARKMFSASTRRLDLLGVKKSINCKQQIEQIFSQFF